MTFLELYGIELDRELGTEDRTQLFTTVRRKAAVNAAALEFLERTNCFQRQVAVTLVSGTQEYDLEAEITDFGSLAKEGISIWIVSGTTVRYLEGDNLKVTTWGRLNAERPNWRATPAGTPTHVYTRKEGGTLLMGFYPAPSIDAADVWVAQVHAHIQPAAMTADDDLPYTLSSNAVASLRPYHRALTHYAAYDLEKFRKDTARGAAQLQMFEHYIDRYETKQKPLGGQVIRLARDYRRVGRRGGAFETQCSGGGTGSTSLLELVEEAPASPYENQLWFELVLPSTVNLNWYHDAVTTVLYTTDFA